MNILFDYRACERFCYLASLQVDGSLRGYYALAPEDEKLAILVTRGALLGDLREKVVDVTLGWDNGIPGFVFYPGQMHTKITAFGRIEAPHEGTLSEVLSKAPERRKE